MGSPEFVIAFVRSKAKILHQDVQMLRIVPDPMIHYALLRFCQNMRLAFLPRNVPPAILMQPVDVNFDPASGVRISPVAVPMFIQDLIVNAVLQHGLGATYDTLPAYILAWCRTIVELPHHEGGLGIAPLPASGMAAFYIATASLVSWLGSLPHASQWDACQTLDDRISCLCSALTTLKQLHGKLLTLYNCSEWAPPPPAGPAAAPATDAPAQGHDVDNAHPLSLPPLNLLASLRARQDEENGENTVRPSLPPQRQVTKRIMQQWTLHKLMLRNPPTDRMRDVRLLHCTQSVPLLDAHSALRRNMPQRNDEEGGKTTRISFSPASSVWGLMGRLWASFGCDAPRTTATVTEQDYGAFFHQFFGFTNNPALAPFANEQCPCQLYLMGGDGAWDHINSCIYHSANWTTAHEHVLQAFERICNDAGFATRRKQVLTSEGSRSADLEIRNILLADKVDLLVDITIRHDFIGAGRSGLNQGQLRNPDNPDHILESAAADKIRNHRDACAVNRQVAFLPACMTTSGPIHGEFLRVFFFLSNKQADDYFAALGYEAHKEEFCHRLGVFFYRNLCTIGLACAQDACSVAWLSHHSSSPRLRPSPPAAPTPRRR
jgi:hypothetical protein